MPNIKPDDDQLENNDQKILRPDIYLNTDKEHKDWHLEGQMGKQRGMPRIAPKEGKKPKGIKKHSTRKEIR